MMTLDGLRKPIDDSDDIRVVRRLLIEELDALGCREVAYEAGVMVSELVTNALVHATAPAVVTVQVGQDDIRVSVHDGSDERPVVQPVDPHRIGGNGMRLVEAFAEDWGVDPDPAGGKSVWFTVPRAA